MFDVYRRIRAKHSGDEKLIAEEWNSHPANAELVRGNVGNVVDHIEHIAEVAGIDGVGLGSDFDGMTVSPVGLEDASCYPAITEELLERGWRTEDILKVLGENSLRVLDV